MEKKEGTPLFRQNLQMALKKNEKVKMDFAGSLLNDLNREPYFLVKIDSLIVVINLLNSFREGRWIRLVMLLMQMVFQLRET